MEGKADVEEADELTVHPERYTKRGPVGFFLGGMRTG